LKNKIKLKKASWIQLEMAACVYTWNIGFKYPIFILRILGIFTFLSIILLNIYPPPLLIGFYICTFYHIILGGAVYTWFVNYKSIPHSIPVFITFLCINMINYESEIETNVIQKNLKILLPLFIGFLGGPIFSYLGRVENMYLKYEKWM
jgi:hypothetical protein